jgi:ubiquinone/menaquinone biosynthesis C-methylase UbiE
VLALIELNRVLKPGGIIGIRAADSSGILLDADSDEPTEGLAAYFANRANDGVDPNVGAEAGSVVANRRI